MQPPLLLALSASQIQLTWFLPVAPNGIVILYRLFQVAPGDGGSGGVQVATSPRPDSSVVSGLLPFTEYSFALEACTAQGCTRSQTSSAFTVEGGELSCPVLIIMGVLELTFQHVASYCSCGSLGLIQTIAIVIEEANSSRSGGGGGGGTE